MCIWIVKLVLQTAIVALVVHISVLVLVVHPIAPFELRLHSSLLVMHTWIVVPVHVVH